MSGGATAFASADTDFLDIVPAASNARLVDFEFAEDTKSRAVGRAPEPIPVLYPLFRLGERRLSRPLVVVVEADGDSVIMSSPRLRVWGTGSDVYQARADFSQTFIDVYESYRATPREQLTPGAVEFLRVLQSFWAE